MTGYKYNTFMSHLLTDNLGNLAKYQSFRMLTI